MALFSPGHTRCPLCGVPIEAGDPQVATAHFLDVSHALGRYSDAVMHRACFLRWENREAFVAAYNAWTATDPWGSGRPPPRMRLNGSHVGDRRRRWVERWEAVVDRLESLRWRWRHPDS